MDFDFMLVMASDSGYPYFNSNITINAMNNPIKRLFLLATILLLSACSGDESGKSDFDMTGLWSVSIIPGRTLLLDIDSQNSGSFTGSGGAYLVEGNVDGNEVNMSIFIPGSVRCPFQIQQTEEFQFNQGVIENVSPADGQFGEINTAGNWFTNCTVIEVQITAVKQE